MAPVAPSSVLHLRSRFGPEQKPVISELDYSLDLAVPDLVPSVLPVHAMKGSQDGV